MSKKEAELQTQLAPRYTKEQLVRAKRFTTSDKDILTALLMSDKTYALEDAEGVIKSFKEREV